MRSTRLIRTCCGVISVAVLALLLAACGSSGGSGTGTQEATTGAEEPAGEGGSTDARTERAEELGRQAAEESGGSVELPPKKAGILNILGSIESAQRSEKAMKAAIADLGWSSQSCDAEGDPTKMTACGNSLLDSGVEVMFTIGIEPSLIKGPLQKAKQEGVPVVSFAGKVAPDPLWAGAYYPSDPESGTILAAYVEERLNELEGTKEVAINSYPAAWSELRTDRFRKVVKENPDWKLVANQTTDAANLVEGTRQQVTDTLTANPDIKAYWFGFDSAGQVGGQAVAAKYPGKSFPERPLVVTFDADLATQELIRAGAIDAVVDVAYPASAWVAADQAAQFFARQTPMSTSPRPKYPATFYDNEIVTKENLPPEGQYREPKDDYEKFFETKWETEFGKGG
jgi:ABC-type sugar transport system substrate-binding protein